MHAQRQAGTATPDTAAHPSRRVTSFRSRRAALNDTQQEVWDRLWPELGRLALPAEGQPVQPIDAEAWFGRRAAGLVCEIGCGTGTSTLAMAQTEPDIDVIAVEVYRRGLAQLLNAIDRTGVPNIRLVRGDGVDVLEHLIGPESLTGVRVFFPDPWPKSRHHKRRLLQPPIRRNIKLAEAPSFGQTIFDYDPKCAGADDYRGVANSLIAMWNERAASDASQQSSVSST